MSNRASFADYLKSLPFYILPHHLLSRMVYKVTRIRSQRFVPSVIQQFSKVFKVNLDEAAEPDPTAYETFNAFFTRALKAGIRPIAQGERIIASPVDGAISQLGLITEGRIIQAKGQDYTVQELLGGDERIATPFLNGQFATIYLSPRDYHRIHMPLAGTLTEQIYVPGRLFSVAGFTVRTIPRVFARNERVVALFDTAFGKMAMVLVGAMNVAAIETVWAGLVTPPQHSAIKRETYNSIQLEKGQEMGRFNMGSTVILLFERSGVKWHESCAPDIPIRLGEKLAEFTH